MVEKLRWLDSVEEINDDGIIDNNEVEHIEEDEEQVDEILYISYHDGTHQKITIIGNVEATLTELCKIKDGICEFCGYSPDVSSKE